MFGNGLGCCLLLWLLAVWYVGLLIATVACFACDGCCCLVGCLVVWARCWWVGLVLRLVCALV